MRILKGLIVSISIFTAVAGFAGSVAAEDQPASAEVLNKLDDIAAEQKNILRELSDIKQELEIIKIRVTQRQ